MRVDDGGCVVEALMLLILVGCTVEVRKDDGGCVVGTRVVNSV